MRLSWGNKIKQKKTRKNKKIIVIQVTKEEVFRMNKLKLFWGMVITLAFMLVLAGCSGDSTNSSSTAGRSNVSRDTVYEFYDKVKLNQTKEQVDAELGVTPTESSQLKNSFTYVNEDTSFGVSVLFDENGLATSKTLFYSMTEDLAFLTTKTVTKEQAESIPNGATYDEVKNILGGEGTETSATQIPFEDNKVSYIRVWVNQDGTMLQAVFLTDGTTNNVMYFN
ncbi:MAG: hypothetical protein CVU99_08105 [Firmicutes bacterium HGW-Firmicutes-4]|jgi:hypothetical protein|nr:MAG: hypothetical protein CVU99_08105 [Firmicutes bacterium HGW-Firmicutes-4]